MIFLFGLLAMVILIGIVAPRVMYVMLIILAVPLTLVGIFLSHVGSRTDHLAGKAFIAAAVVMVVVSFMKLFQKATPDSPEKVSEEKTEEKKSDA